MHFSKSIILVSIWAISSVFAWQRQHPFKNNHLHPDGWQMHPPHLHSNATSGNGTFTQVIDHNDPALGTFQQSYWWSSEYYNGPGSPVILFTPGEVNASGYTSYLTTNRTTGVLASQIGAAVIVLEHRYWGYSSPFADLTTDNMQYLTLNNSISDLTYFAKNVRLPFDRRRSSTPAKAPWLLMGGSYSGALSAWTASTQPGTFFAYHASSAPVESIDDYWQYFVPVQEGMPKNCSADISLVVDHIDGVLTTGTTDEKAALKDMFGLGAVEHDDDFAAALENGPWLWQGNQFYSNTGFFDFCDAVENSASNSTNSSLPSAAGVGLDKALAGYSSWFNTTFLPGYCASYGYEEWQDTYSTLCFNTYNVSSPMFTDRTVSNKFDRQWEWMICNEPFGYWQDGAPANRSSLVSRLVTADYWRRQCSLFFPPGDKVIVGLEAGRSEDQVNAFTRGWDFTNSERLIWVNGDYDPWREAGVSSEFRPGGPLQSTSNAPVVIVPGGFHTSDLVTRNGLVNAGAQAAIDQVLTQMRTWVGEFEPQE